MKNEMQGNQKDSNQKDSSLTLTIKRVRTRVATGVKTGGTATGSCVFISDPTITGINCTCNSGHTGQ